MNTGTKTAIDIIKFWEGFEAKAYKDAAGLWTIGWGTLLEDKPELYKRFVTNGETISKQEAEKLLIEHVKKDEATIKRLVSVDTTKNQIEALKSFVYNVGAGNFQKSTLLKKLNAGDKQGAGEEFRKWIFAGGVKLNGLIKRREEERKLFLS